jgi:hypothetical protein
MTKTNAELVADITQDIADVTAAIPDNTSKQVSPARVRAQLLDVQTRLLDMLAREGQANGVAGLDAQGKVAQPPAAADGGVLNAGTDKVLVLRGGSLVSIDPFETGEARPTDFVLSNATIDEDALAGTAIGTFSFVGGSAPFPTLELVADPDSKAEIVGDDLILAGILDFESASSHPITVRATDADGWVLEKDFSIIVGDVAGDANYFVDSVNGNDGNDGLTIGAAFQSLAVARAAIAPTNRLWLVRGSAWREQFDIPCDNCIIGVAGTGAMPIIDGADIVAVTWTQPNVGTYANVWSVPWVRASPTITANEYLGLWLNGVRPRYATSLADLQTNGGWYSSDLLAQNTTVYIKSATDPNSSGALYEVSRRHYGFNGHRSIIGTPHPGQFLEGPIEIKRCHGHYNALSMGTGRARRMFLRDGNVHHCVTEAELLEDMMATEYSPAIGPSVFVAFRDDGTGFSPTIRRALALMPGGLSRVSEAGASALYSHSSVVQQVAAVRYEGCAARGLNFASASAQSLAIAGGYCEDPYESAVGGSGSVLTTVSHLLVRDTGQTPNAAGNQLIGRTSTIGSFALEHVASHTMKGAAVRNLVGGVKPTIANTSISNSQLGAVSGGEVSMHYSVLFCAYRPLDNITNQYVGDFNVFYNAGQSSPVFQWNGNVYANVGTSFSDFVTASGQDQNSVYLKDADQVSGNGNAFWLGVSLGVNAGPPDGDFRISPSARVYDRTNTARIGVFGDGVTPITAAGPQEHYDFDTRLIAVGAPSRYPVLPVTVANMRSYLEAPQAWEFYP